MADSKIIVTSSDSNNRLIQKIIPNINPNADNDKLKVFGQKLTALTDNTLSKVERVDKTNITSAVEKLTPLVKLNDAADPLKRSVCLNGASPLLDVTTDGELSIVTGDSVSWCSTIYKKIDGSAYRLYVGIVNSQTAGQATAPYDIVIRSTETDTYKAGEFHITINADE